MAAIDDLIAQIDDKALRERLQAETDRLTKQKRFGLVFEEHLPELTPIPSARVRKGSLVAKRGKALTDVWHVLSVAKGQAHCLNRASGEQLDMATDDLVVVRQFGEPIFPALVPVDRVQNGPADSPWHTLIEADNYHALQLLEYLYAGQVDCIYIDPPYNTGARDWKYNNDYVDVNDRWRHSKWLAMMHRRLVLAKRLLNPLTGVLIVTIDEHEVNHLGMLLEQVFPGSPQQMATIVINEKGIAQGRLSRVEEYAFFVFMPEAYLPPAHDDLLALSKKGSGISTPRWERLLRGGTNSRRQDRHRLFFPIFIDPNRKAITSIGEPLPLAEMPNLVDIGRKIAWPLRTDGSFGNWRVSPPTLRELVAKGSVKVGGYDTKRKTWTILYLGEKARRQIAEGVILIAGRDEQAGAVKVKYAESQESNVKTVWHRGAHDSGIYGSSMLRTIVGRDVKFDFPKSLYSVRDAIAAAVRDRPNALILDFFAGSGTTLHAVNLLNATDGGKRRCILVTNNEVSDEEAKVLTVQAHRPGDDAWEKHGICRSVTWPRSKYTIRGKRDDGTELEGEYFTGKTVEKEKARSFTQIGFVDPAALDNVAKKKQVLALIDGLPQTLVKDLCPFIVSDDHKVSILFDPAAAESWLESLAEQDHITDFYIVTPVKKVFDGLKTQVIELLGPLLVNEDEKRPMNDGFPANLEYFKLEFLEKDAVALG